MYNTDSLLNRINQTRTNQPMTLTEIQPFSFSELRKMFEGQLSWGEAHYLYQEAVEQKKRNRLLEARIFTRVNPQLPRAIRLGIEQDSLSRSYDDMFGSRSSSFVNPGSVASMFSPAGYLTELYREAKNLHHESSAYYLDKRRPDLSDLALSQHNMDAEISTLTLSNELLLEHITRKTGNDAEALMENLSTYRQAIDAPYHQPYETIRQVIMAHDSTLSALSRNPEVMAQAEGASLLAILANISPELYHILIEEITEENAEALFAKNFGENIKPENFASQSWIARHYGLELSEVQKYLGMLQHSYSDNVSAYIDNISSGLISDNEGKLEAYKITRIPGGDYANHLNFWDLIYQGDSHFVIRASFKQNNGDLMIRKSAVGTIGGSQAIGKFSAPLHANTVYQSDVLSPLTVEELKEGKTIFAYNHGNGSSGRGTPVFVFESYPLNIFALKLNKAIRLCLASGLSPDELQPIVYSDNTQGIINDSVLTKVFYTLFYNRRYALSFDDAQVLNGSAINQYADDNNVSHFDRIFNTPALKGKTLEADGKTVSIDPGESQATFARSALMRGLGVNSGELYQLGKLAGVLDSQNNITLSVSAISSLYRLKLLAYAHQLTVYELCMLYDFSPFSGEKMASLSFDKLAQLVIWLYQMTQWLTEAGITTEELWILCTSEFSGNISPEINNLLNAIRPRINQEIAQSNNRELQAEILAPFIAATLNLASPDMARYILLWTDTLQARDLDIGGFMQLALEETLNDAQAAQLVQFCHVMAQLSLSVQKLHLSEAELSVLIASDFSVLGAKGQPAGQHNIDMLFSLYRFHQWINKLGNLSSDTLDMLHQRTLTADRLSSVMRLDSSMVTQAMDCAGVSNLQNWRNINTLLQWIDVASALHTMPSMIRMLVNIRYVMSSNETGAALPSWKEWQTLAENMEAGLSTQQAQVLAEYTAERLSAVLCNWYLANMQPEGVFLQNRDDLYSYFLIDNQVSSAVKTTRLAEAIAGIQLYINRALNRIEPNARADVSTRQFFTDWAVNNRYSTWGGVSRLVYYPENYIDPTQRIGQTRMMDELLENISQSKLSRDTVEEAFKTYLTRFETVADLKVVSAYHDNVNSDTGLTWFIGQTRENLPEYYWRNVDISRMQAGKLPANAWKEWTKIDTAVSPYGDAVRPVVFRERLHLIWLERDEVAENGTDPVKTSDRFTLKLAFLRHDGSWSAPWVYDITTQVETGIGYNPDTERLGLAASGFQGEDTLLVFVYKTGKQYGDFGSNNKNVAGLYIYADGTSNSINGEQLSRYSIINNTFDIISSDEGRIVKRANYKFAQGYEIPSSLALNSTLGQNTFISIDDASIPEISYKHSSENLIITLNNPRFTLNYRADDELRRHQLIAMKACGQQEHTFILANKVSRYLPFQKMYGPIPVYNVTNNTIGAAQNSPFYPGEDFSNYIFLNSGINNEFLFPISPYENTTSFHVGLDQQETFKKCDNTSYRFKFAIGFNLSMYLPIFASKLEGWYYFDPNIDASNILFSIKKDGEIQIVTAKDAVNNLPNPSFEGMNYVFNPITLDASDLKFINDTTSIDVYFEVKDKDGKITGKSSSTLTIKKVNYSSSRLLHLYETHSGTQYMQLGIHRIRLNTLLAPQLVSRANTGIDTILTMETQRLPEPNLGEGFFANFVLPKYNPTEHGDERWFKIHIGNIDGNDGGKPYSYYSGMLSDTLETRVTLFVPYAEGYYMHQGVRLGVGYQKITYDDTWQSAFFYFDKGKNQFVLINDADHDSGMTNNGIVNDIKKYKGFVNVSIATDYSAPMDFNGANALYYWELFYYTPMMCFQRLLQEKQFDEASKWMNYVYNPAGYIINGEIAPWIWNCRPLEETTSWNANPLDAVDPDAVAQNDPTHYKVATFMRLLDQLITRGDMAYRELTRDALNEAKMWYVRALELLGDEPEDYGSNQWAAPSLSVAASQTKWATYQQDLAALDQGEVPTQTRTANSLVGLFLPEYNPALTDYWKTLRLRLFNLRNNLSIDGQPLSLAIYAEPTDPKALLTSMVQTSQGGSALPTGTLSLYRFPVMLERARNLVGQLTQFGASLLSMAEHDDADELTTLLLQQGMELATQSIRIQQRTVDEVDADIAVLKESRHSAQSRLEKYQQLYDEDINAGEQRAMSLFDAAADKSLAAQALTTAEGMADLVPTIFGFACGGSRWGAALRASASVLSLSSTASQYTAEKINRSETYRRRRQEWEIQRDNADGEVRQMDAQLEALKIRREAAQMQVEYQETQQAQTQAQLELLQRKFTNKALYSWMRGKLSAIYYQFFDLTQSFCLMAQEALRRELTDNGMTFIRGGVWNGTTAGLMAGETLLLNLAEMEKAWLERDERALEVTRTVSLAQFYQALSSDSFSLTEQLTQILRDGKGSAGQNGNMLELNQDQIKASVRLSDLKIFNDYPGNLGGIRQLKQVSVSLPALIGPYDDIRAVLNYGGSVVMPRGCNAIAISHGINDSGQFMLDFNDPRYLPFEGIPVDDSGSLTLSFPQATDRQKAMLQSLNDIILHLRYTIRSEKK